MTSNSFGARDRLTVGDATYEIVRLNRVAGSARLPFSLKMMSFQDTTGNDSGTCSGYVVFVFIIISLHFNARKQEEGVVLHCGRVSSRPLPMPP